MTAKRARRLFAGAAAVVALAVAASVALAAQSADSKTVSTDHGVATTITLTGTSDLGVAAFNITAGPDHGGLDLPTTGPMVCVPNGGSFDCSADVLYTPNASYEGTDSFTYNVQDVDGTSADATVSITVGSAPVAVDDPNGACATGVASGFFTTFEDTPLTVPANATCGLLSNDTDADAGDTLTASLNTDGSLGSASVGTDGGFTYTPTANANGDDTFTYDASDGALSDTATVKVRVIAVNDAPSFSAGVDQEVSEDSGQKTVAGWATSISAGPNETQALNFVLFSDDNATLFSTAPAISPTGTLTFTPAANANGVAHVSFKLHDDGGTLNGGVDTSGSHSLTITVDAVNDAPSFTAGSNPTVGEDSGAYAGGTGWASAISAGPSNESGQTVTFAVTGNDNASLFSVAPAVATNGTLTFTPAANANGVAHMTVTAHDDGGTAGGGVDSSSGHSLTITVTAVNDVPSFTAGADVTVNEDSGAYALGSGWATAISAGPSNESGQTVDFQLTTDSNSTLFTTEPAVAADGTLTFTPAPNANGSSTVGFKIHDDGGTSGGGANLSAEQTFTINVTAVNDAPSFTPGANVIVNQDTPAYTGSGWATAISAGPADESGQTVAFSFTADDNPTLFSVAPAVASDGTLTFTPAAARSGTAHLSLQAQDNGGTGNGGVDTSGSVSVTIRINANPNAVPDSVNVMENSPGTLMNLLANDTSLPDPPEALTITAVSNDGVLGPLHGTLTIALDGSSVTYVPTPGYYGSDFFRYYIADPYGGTDFATVFVTIVKDTTAPTVASPAQRIRQGVALSSTTLSGLVTWSGSDAGVGIGHYELQRSVNAGAWTNVTLGAPTATTAYVTYAFGSTTYRFRVRGVDLNGNTSAWLYTATFHDARYEERNTALNYGGTWSLVFNSNDSGGAAKETSVSGRSVTMTTKFRDIGVVTMKGPGRGSIAIYVDGVYKGTVSLVAATTRYRQVAWTAHYGLGTHTIKIVAVGNVRLDFDCFVTLY